MSNNDLPDRTLALALVAKARTFVCDGYLRSRADSLEEAARSPQWTTCANGDWFHTSAAARYRLVEKALARHARETE